MKAEVLRAVRRDPRASVSEAEIQRVFDDITFLRLDESLVDRAGRLDPPILRSLDAIHLASALLLQDELDALVTYDRRLAQAAAQLGIRVFPEPSEN